VTQDDLDEPADTVVRLRADEPVEQADESSYPSGRVQSWAHPSADRSSWA
jgi:hypothetical protein